MGKIIENEPGIVWCKPWGDDQGEFVRVSVVEFDPEVHEQHGIEPAAGELSAAELKEKLAELGITFKGNASKPVLQDLYDRALADKAAADAAAAAAAGDQGGAGSP